MVWKISFYLHASLKVYLDEDFCFFCRMQNRAEFNLASYLSDHFSALESGSYIYYDLHPLSA